MTTKTATKTAINYDYAVLDGNCQPDIGLLADSCHHTYESAEKAAVRLNRKNPNNHYYVAEWYATRWARVRPNDSHCPCREWTARNS